MGNSLPCNPPGDHRDTLIQDIMNIKTFITSHILRALFLSCVLCATLFGLIATARKLHDNFENRRAKPFSFYGNAFTGLAEALSGETYLGYYTDLDIADPRAGARFQQTQLILAPVILDLDNTAHRFVLFDCAEPRKCLNKIAEIKARPLKASNQGAILATTIY
jgi:hypothetical protein